jgi:magnesium transporter
MLDVYHSATANRMNEIMKVLSIVSTIFMPLTFIAGIYGMNFEHMPELKERYAYPIVLLLMALSGVAMMVWFRRKKWI